MLTFYILIALMVAIALYVVAHPLLKKTDDTPFEPDQVSLSLYQQRRIELQRDREAGVLSDEQSITALAELERTLLDEINVSVTESIPVETAEKRTTEKWTVALVALLLPVLAGTLYYNLGHPELITGLQVASSLQPDDEIHNNASSIEDMVEMLAQRMRDNPEDPKGWVMLGRSYMTLGRFQEAANAYKQLRTLVGDEPNILLMYADALAMANNRSLLGQPEELIMQALELDPDNITGLWLAGRTADEKGQYKTAVDYWLRLLPLLKQDPKSTAEVRQLIKTAQGKLGIPEAEQISLVATENNSPDQLDNAITVNVELDPALVERTSPEDILFIFAQALDGSPMPLAAARKQVKDLPLEVTLDDSMAMLPSQKISGHSIVKISARISKSGSALPQSGDLTATPVQFTVGLSDPVSLVINTLIP